MVCPVASALRERLEIRSLPAAEQRTELNRQAVLLRKHRSGAYRHTKLRRQTPLPAQLRQGQLPTRFSPSTVPQAEPDEKAHWVPPVAPVLPVVAVFSVRTPVVLPELAVAPEGTPVLAIPPVLSASAAKFRSRTRPVPTATEGESLLRAAACAQPVAHRQTPEKPLREAASPLRLQCTAAAQVPLAATRPARNP
jgi:hypothetical protein